MGWQEWHLLEQIEDGEAPRLTSVHGERQGAGMIEWLVEFEGRQKLLSEVRSAEALRLVEPLRHTVAKALDRSADPASLDGLKVIICSEKEGWGFRLEGPAPAVNHAVYLLGREVSTIPPIH